MIHIIMYDRGAYVEAPANAYVFHPVTPRGRERMASATVGTWDEHGALHVLSDDEASAINDQIGEDFPMFVYA